MIVVVKAAVAGGATNGGLVTPPPAALKRQREALRATVEKRPDLLERPEVAAGLTPEQRREAAALREAGMETIGMETMGTAETMVAKKS